MRIKNQPLLQSHTRTVQLPRPDGTALHLTVAPLPLGFHGRLRQRGVAPPQPPTRVARDSQGQPLRDRQGTALLVSDEHDAGYLEAIEQYHQRVAVLVLVESLRADPDVEFDAQPPGPTDNWSEYADRLYEELQQAGWTDGDLIRLCDEISRLSNLLTDHVDEAQQNFSAGPPPAPSPPT